MKKLSFLFSVLIMAACSSPPSHWSSMNHAISVKSEIAPEAGYDLTSMMNEWSKLRTPIFFHYWVDGKVDVFIYENFTLPYLGKTHKYIDEYGHIKSVTIELNTQEIEKLEPGINNAKNRVLCHELGHALGLEHRNYDNESCMVHCKEKEIPGVTRQQCMLEERFTTPSELDRKELLELYSHGD